MVTEQPMNQKLEPGDSRRADISTAELSQVRLTLRKDLIFYRRRLGRRDCYIIEDPATGGFHQIGLEEYTLISVLDGTRTLADAVRLTTVALGNQALGESEVAALGHWLIESDLAFTQQAISAGRIQKKHERRSLIETSQWLNPIMFRFRLGRPDGSVAWLSRWLSWIWSWPLACVWVVVVLAALLGVFDQWDRLTVGIPQIAYPSQWIYLLASWLVLKSFHELGHALVCKKFGGEVREWGVMWMLFVPLPYVDVTSSWRFESKWERVLTSLAGMAVELFLAAIAAFVWLRTDSGPLNQLAYHAILTAGFATLLFNANPLMRFDGYYVLSDGLDLPNLAQNGQQFVRQVARRIFLGDKRENVRRSMDRVGLVRAYGIAALLWRIVVTLGLVFAAASLLPGFGLVLAIFAVGAWYGIPVVKLWRYLYQENLARRLERRRFWQTTAIIAAAAVVAAMLIPGPNTATAPAIIEFDPLQVVRAKTDGFVRELAVCEGDAITRGQLLARLENEELLTIIAELRFRIAELRIKGQKFLLDENLSAYQTTVKDREAQQTRLEQLQREATSLEIRAEADGVVLTGDLLSMQGSFAKRGQALFTIGDPQQKKAIALIRPEDSAAARSAEEQSVGLRLYGQWGTAITGTVARVSARATSTITHEAFSASYGGGLPVVQRSKQSRNEVQTESIWELAEPRVEVEIRLNPETSSALFAGQRGQIRFEGQAQSLGSYLVQVAFSWTRDHTRFNHGL